jgi:hypothetical protein
MKVMSITCGNNENEINDYVMSIQWIIIIY